MPVNYDRCLKMDLLPLWECIYYALGREPQRSHLMGNNIEGLDKFGIAFYEMLEMVSAAYQLGILKIYPSGEPRFLDWSIIPLEFFNWVKNKIPTIPETLNYLVKEKLSKTAKAVTPKVNGTTNIKSHNDKKEALSASKEKIHRPTQKEIYPMLINFRFLRNNDLEIFSQQCT